jgi:xanthine dehydrogenase molybdopterin-binding subunit B
MTNLPGNTAFRGFGVPQVGYDLLNCSIARFRRHNLLASLRQSCLISEDMICSIARFLRLPPDLVRSRNFYRQPTAPIGAPLSSPSIPRRTPYGQAIKRYPMQAMWEQIQTQADVAARREAIEAFNHTHRWHKKGLAIVPTMYGECVPGGRV